MSETEQKFGWSRIMIATIMTTIITLGTFLALLHNFTLENSIKITLLMTITAIIASGASCLFFRGAWTFLGASILACGCVLAAGCYFLQWSDSLAPLIIIGLMGGYFLTAFSKEDILSLNHREEACIAIEFLSIPIAILLISL